MTTALQAAGGPAAGQDAPAPARGVFSGVLGKVLQFGLLFAVMQWMKSGKQADTPAVGTNLSADLDRPHPFTLHGIMQLACTVLMNCHLFFGL
jgi:hypothetical protein